MEWGRGRGGGKRGPCPAFVFPMGSARYLPRSAQGLIADPLRAGVGQARGSWRPPGCVAGPAGARVSAPPTRSFVGPLGGRAGSSWSPRRAGRCGRTVMGRNTKFSLGGGPWLRAEAHGGAAAWLGAHSMLSTKRSPGLRASRGRASHAAFLRGPCPASSQARAGPALIPQDRDQRSEVGSHRKGEP